MDPLKSSRKRTSLYVRAAAFLIWAITLQFWIQRHLGRSLGDVLGVGGILAMVTAGMAYLDHLLSDPEREQVQAIKGRILSFGRLLITFPALMFLYVSSLVLGTAYSSVLVIPGHLANATNLSLVPLDGTGTRSDRRLSPGEGPVRILVRTTPFGSAYQLNVGGYLPLLIRIPPFRGAEVSVEEEMRHAPTVLARIPLGAFSSMQGGGHFYLWRNDSLVADVPSSKCAFFVGPPRTLGPDRITWWNMHLTATDSPPERVAAGAILEWSKPDEALARIQVEPGDRLRFRACGPAHTIIASDSILVYETELIDVLLTEQSEGIPCAH